MMKNLSKERTAVGDARRGNNINLMRGWIASCVSTGRTRVQRRVQYGDRLETPMDFGERSEEEGDAPHRRSVGVAQGSSITHAAIYHA